MLLNIDSNANIVIESDLCRNVWGFFSTGMIKGSGFEVFHSRILLGRKIQHAFWVQGDLIKRDLSIRWNLVNTQTKGACYGVCIIKGVCSK